MSTSKYKVLDEPVASPGKCAFCGIAHGGGARQFVDTLLDLDWYGVVYICTTCLVEIANGLGYVTPKQHEMVMNFNIAISKANEELEKENADLRAAVNSLSASTRIPLDQSILHSNAKRAEVPPVKVKVGGGANAENAPHVASKGPTNTGGPKPSSDSEFLKELGL